MKITRKKLQNIIKEEITNVFKEQQAVMTPGVADGGMDPNSVVRGALNFARYSGAGVYPIQEYAKMIQFNNFKEVTADYSHFDGDPEDNPALAHLRNIAQMRQRYGKPKILKVSDEKIKERILQRVDPYPGRETLISSLEALPANIVAQEVAKIAAEPVKPDTQEM